MKSLTIDPWPAEEPLFKYLEPKYANRLLSTGKLRIGTLYDFRDQEQYGDQRGDNDEGKKELYEQIDDCTIQNSHNNPLSPFANKIFRFGENAQNTRLVNFTVTQKQDCNNCYVYCMSKKHNKSLKKGLNAKVCIRIEKPYEFIEAITLALKNVASVSDNYKISECKYKDRKQQYGKHDDYHPAIIKPLSYKYQEEVRAIWLPTNVETQIQPLEIQINKEFVNCYCRVEN